MWVPPAYYCRPGEVPRTSIERFFNSCHKGREGNVDENKHFTTCLKCWIVLQTDEVHILTSLGFSAVAERHPQAA